MNALEDILEKEWEATIYKTGAGLAPMLGWRLVYHTLHSKGSRAGFPDRVLVRERVIFAESKREKRVATPISPDQRDWLDGLARAGQEVYLWRPSDLDEVARVLSKRWTKTVAGSTPGLALTEGSIETFWQPNSMWVAGVGRADEQTPEEPDVPGQTTIHDFVS